jgi:signal transduction histidine kinase/HAMP domain-containing protein
MSPAGGRLARWRHGLFLILVGPFLLALGTCFGLLDPLPVFRPATLEQAREGLVESFALLLDQAANVAEAALRSAETGTPPPAAPGALAARIEGTALLDARLQFLDWTGRPADPPLRFADPDWPRWSVRVDGLWTRLLVRAGPDWKGRFALVSAVIDTTLPDRRFLELLPPDLLRGVRFELFFQDTEFLLSQPRFQRGGVAAPPPAPRSLPESHTLWLRSPSGQILAAAAIAPLSPELTRAKVHRAAGAWSALLACLIFLLCVNWTSRTRTARGLAVALVSLVLARWLLLWQEIPLRLLPRPLGTATRFGSSGYGELFASPGDLLLTALAAYLGAVALRQYLGRLAASRLRLALATAAGAATLTTATAFSVTLLVARNARMPLLDRPTPLGWDDRLLLWTGLILLLTAAAELWARLSNLLRRGGIGAPPSRLAVVLSLAPLIAVASLLLQYQAQQIALEQLSSELAREVSEQSRRRFYVLQATIEEIENRVLRHDPGDPTQSFKPQDMAYRYWVEGELFHSGYRSSLTFYTPEGHPVSHFGFGLPALAEEVVLSPTAIPGRLQFRHERFAPTAAIDQGLFHAEIPVYNRGQPLGTVVGHVLDEPDNLPFLPWSQPYLSALGPAPRGAGREYPDSLQYVLYDPLGEVVLTTLTAPPAVRPAFREAGREGSRVRTRAGEGAYVGIALTDELQRAHLLLLPSLGFLGPLASIVRVEFLGLAVLLVLRILGWLHGLGGGAAWLPLGRQLHGSIYRKLLAASLIAAGIPLVGLALFLRGYVEHRAQATLASEATRLVRVARHVVEDYWATQSDSEGGELPLNDAALYWLRSVVGQEIHVYENGSLLASSKPELFTSGLLPLCLDGRVRQKLVQEGLPYLVLPTMVGRSEIPVAYTRARTLSGGQSRRIVAVPLVLEQRQIAEGTARVAEIILLATVALFALLAAAAASLASSVARPVRQLVAATDRISTGDYSTRLAAHTRDEIAELVRGFNAMGEALQRQRADLQSQRDYMQTLLHHHTTCVISLDARGRIVTFNPSAANLLGAGADGLRTGAGLHELLDARDGFQPLADALARPSAAGAVEVDLIRDDATRRYRMVRVELGGREGEEVGSLILIDDVTDLMRSNQLEAWAEMARVIAHEIKNPLTPIQLAGEHLRRLLHDRGLLPSRDVEACLETIIKQVRALHTIAGEFSAYARLPDLQPESTDPVEFMRETLEPYRNAPAPGVELVEAYRNAPVVSIDRRVLARAVINLLENALQAMPEGGTLTVGVQADAARKQVLLSVQDTGIGLLPEVRRRLFEPYFSTKSSGTGLGLAILRRAVEAHHGEVEVESALGQGSRFVIRLPVRHDE